MPGTLTAEHTLLPGGIHDASAEFEHVETPAELDAMHPLDHEAMLCITAFRREDIAVTQGRDPRLRVTLRPCSLDNSRQTDGTPSYLSFQERVKELRENPLISRYLSIMSGSYPEKPRTGDEDFRGLAQRSLKEAYSLLTAAANMQVPLRGEVMSRDHIARYGDRLTSFQVGARDVGSTLLRHTLSAYRVPTYCKNAESGNIHSAVNAMATIATPHEGVEVTLADGRHARLAKSPGNPNVGFIYRGGEDVDSPVAFRGRLEEISQMVVPYEVDCAHEVEKLYGDGRKSVEGQVAAFEDVLRLMRSGRLGALPVGIMLEVYLLEGADTTQQTPGMSWTDPCIGINQATEMVLDLARERAKLLERS